MSKNNGILGFFKNLISAPKIEIPDEVLSVLPNLDNAPIKSKESKTPKESKEFKKRENRDPENTGPVSDEIAHYSIEKLSELLALSFGGNPVIADQSNGELSLEVIGATDSSRLIGKDGMTLDALQTLLRAIIFKKFNTNIKVSINTEDYKRRREDQIRAQAEKGLNAVLAKNSRVSLRPMNASERRLVHVIFENDPRVRTFSTGNGNYRHVVIEKRGPKSQNNDPR